MLWLNDHRMPALDIFFQLCTYLGDWIIMVLILVVFLIRDRRIGLAFLYSGFVMGLILGMIVTIQGFNKFRKLNKIIKTITENLETTCAR